MSYGQAAALQAAVYQHLAALPELAGIPVVDAVPKGQGAGTFVLIGSEEVRDLSDASGSGAEHRFAVSVISPRSPSSSGSSVVMPSADSEARR